LQTYSTAANQALVEQKSSAPKDGKDVPAKNIVWAKKDNRSFANSRYFAHASGTLKRDWTFLYARKETDIGK